MSVAETLPPPTSNPSGVISDRDVERAQQNVNSLTESLGTLTIKKSKPVRDSRGLHHVRHLGVMTAQGLKYPVCITDPAVELGYSEAMLDGHFPGFMEDHDRGTAADLHNDKVAQYPARRVATFSSDGYDKSGSPVRWRDIGRSFRHMGVSRLMLLGELAGDDEVTLFCVSKGTRLAREVVEQNADMQRIKHLFTGVISPAMLEDHVPRDMGVFFIPHMGYETGREVVQHPWRSFHTAVSQRPSLGRTWRRLPAYTCDLINLFQTCPIEDVRVLAEGPRKLAIIEGETDPLGHRPLWQAVQQEFPDNVEMRVIPGVGHAASANSLLIARTLFQMEQSLRARSTTSSL